MSAVPLCRCAGELSEKCSSVVYVSCVCECLYVYEYKFLFFSHPSNVLHSTSRIYREQIALQTSPLSTESKMFTKLYCV